MEHDSSFLCSQQPIIGPNSEQDVSSLPPPTLTFEIHFSTVLPFTVMPFK